VIAGTGKGRELPIVRELWPNTKIIAVEPFLANIAVIKESGRASYVDEIKQTALWSMPTALRMNYGGERSLVAGVWGFSGQRGERVSAITIDELKRQTQPWPSPILCWLDCEGAEMHVIRGMSFRPRWLNLEIMWRNVPVHIPESYQLQSFMLSLGYKAYGVHSVGKEGDGGDALFMTVEEHRRLSDEYVKIKKEAVARRHRKYRKWRRRNI
jgi:FkbM family methyltransferase